jgi:hypothetical protein
MKFRELRPYQDPAKGARKLLEIANTTEAVQDGRIYVERVNAAFLSEGGTPTEYGAALEFAIERGWLSKHRPGTYVKFTPTGAELFS